MDARSTGLFLVAPPVCSCFWDANDVYWTAVSEGMFAGKPEKNECSLRSGQMPRKF